MKRVVKSNFHDNFASYVIKVKLSTSMQITLNLPICALHTKVKQADIPINLMPTSFVFKTKKLGFLIISQDQHKEVRLFSTVKEHQRINA